MTGLDDRFELAFPELDFSLKEKQKEAITTVIEQGNTLCILPTGAGKSVIYWMAGVESKGITIVVSPLIALISEQAEKIQYHGYETLVLHGGVSAEKQVELLTELANGKYNPKFIFASPEKIATDGYFEHCIRQRKEDISLMVIDEVHCVSQWGLSFRPFYKRIPSFLDTVFEDQWPKILAMTATLNSKELSDVCEAFKIPTQNIVREPLLMRSEIQLHVQKFTNEDEKEEKFWDIVNIHKDEKILVYVYRKQGKRSVEELCEQAIEKGYAAAWFHGDMDTKKRMDIINKLKNGDINIVFATNAFGMGIDIKDIRTVIHFMIPESAEQYYQEVGDIRDPLLKSYYDSTKNKAYVITLKKSNITPKQLSDCVYRCMSEGKVTLTKSPQRWLVLDIKNNVIDDDKMSIMLSSIEEKRAYKHQLLDYLVYILNLDLNSQQLHQELAKYLGTEKHQLNRIYKTADGNHVRSKSEVIICDLLFENHIPYVYEEKLYYDDEHWIEPDFTIKTPNKKDIYWEHVGMLGSEEYDDRWAHKGL